MKSPSRSWNHNVFVESRLFDHASNLVFWVIQSKNNATAFAITMFLLELDVLSCKENVPVIWRVWYEARRNRGPVHITDVCNFGTWNWIQQWGHITFHTVQLCCNLKVKVCSDDGSRMSVGKGLESSRWVLSILTASVKKLLQSLVAMAWMLWYLLPLEKWCLNG